MIFDERHFTYGLFESRAYGLIFAHADTSSLQAIEGNISTNALFNKRDMNKYIISNDYSDYPLSFDAEIFQEDQEPLTREDQRVIERALFNTPEYRRLYVDSEDAVEGETYEVYDGAEVVSPGERHFYLRCRFMNPERIDAGCGVVGYKFTVECESGMLIQEEIETKYTFIPSLYTPKNPSVFVDSDASYYTAPTIVVATGGTAGTVAIINNTDDSNRQTVFVDIPAGTALTINSRVNSVSGEFYQNMHSRNFPRLLSGQNDFTIQGYVSEVRFKWNNRRFL